MIAGNNWKPTELNFGLGQSRDDTGIFRIPVLHSSFLTGTIEPKKPFIIQRLEKYFWKRINRVSTDEIMIGNANGYSVDKEQRLVGLNLRDCRVEDLSFLRDPVLEDLRFLNLSDNDLTYILPLLNLPHLRQLSLEYNGISHLPKEILHLGLEIKWSYDYSEGIFLAGNPLEKPSPQVVKAGHEAVVRSMQEG